MKEIKNAVIIGKKWFHKSYGNTYHVARVIVDGVILQSDITYGYGSQFIETTKEMLKKAGYNTENLLEKAVIYDIYVKRKKDLFF